MFHRAINALMIEAVSTSETSVHFYQTTRCKIPGYGLLHTRRRENLRSQQSVSGPVGYAESQRKRLDNVYTQNWDTPFHFC
jgi:hypothetical protein